MSMGWDWSYKSGIYHDLPSGYVKMAIENGTFIVDFPIKRMVIFYSYASLPWFTMIYHWRVAAGHPMSQSPGTPQ